MIEKHSMDSENSKRPILLADAMIENLISVCDVLHLIHKNDILGRWIWPMNQIG